MSHRKWLIMLPLISALISVPAVGEEKQSKKGKPARAKDAVEWRHKTETARQREVDQIAAPRETQGHRPHDLNGDGKISRKEWPGDDGSFREMDRNGDGFITDADRQLEPRNRVHK